jgi:hypothetical protein
MSKYSKCLPTGKAQSIVAKFIAKGLYLVRIPEFEIPELVTGFLTNTKKDYWTNKGCQIFETNFKKLSQTKGQAIHVEFSWYMNTTSERHAMSLILFKDKYIEFFDPSGYHHQTPHETTWPADKVLYYIISGVIKQSKIHGYTFINMNELNINPDNHCNSWSLYYHFMRFLTYDLTSAKIKNLFVKKWHQIYKARKNKQQTQKSKEIFGKVHNILSSSNSTVIQQLTNHIKSQIPDLKRKVRTNNSNNIFLNAKSNFNTNNNNNIFYNALPKVRPHRKLRRLS